jgi:hypothetical protein
VVVTQAVLHVQEVVPFPLHVRCSWEGKWLAPYLPGSDA